MIKLHVSILLAGFTGLFGKWIHLGEVPLVWWRLALVVAAMLPALYLNGSLRLFPQRQTMAMFAVGSLQCLHWILFYASIKLSTVSVALVCISLMGFFTAILSPLILKTPWSVREFLFSGITIAGIALIFSFDVQYRLGIAVGVVSSFVASLFVIYNKRISGSCQPEILFLYEMAGGLLVVTLAAPLLLRVFPSPSLLPGGSDLLFLLALSLICTVVLYVLQLQALRQVSAFTVNLSLNLEPVYSVILASIFLGESKDYTVSFYWGMGLILLSVALQTVFVVWEPRSNK